MTQKEQLDKLQLLFQGNTRIHGFHQAEMLPELDDPQKINNPVRGFADGPVTQDHWLAHLEGSMGLGIVPIDDYQEVKFMAIDLDLDLMEECKVTLSGVQEKVTALGMPLVICRSKSGACHLYVFFKEKVAAKDVRPTLIQMSDVLGFRDDKGKAAEIYPHTSKLDTDSKGKYINMPYFKAADTARFAYNSEGTTLSLTEFLTFASKRAVTKKEFCQWSPPLNGESSVRDIVVQGPPCLQTIFDSGIPEGMRNDMLFQFAILFKKHSEKKFTDFLEWVNANKTSTPIPTSEVNMIANGIKKKNYHYNCAHACMSPICQKDMCKGRKFGIRGSVDFPEVRKILQYGEANETFEIQFEEGQILRISATDLLNFDRVQADLLSSHHIVIPVVKKLEWVEFVKTLMTKIERVIIPQEYKLEALLKSLILTIATSRTLGTKPEDLLMRKPIKIGDDIVISYKFIQEEIMKRYNKAHGYLPGLELPVIVEELKGSFETITIGNEKMGVVRIPDPRIDHEAILNAVTPEFKSAF